MDNIINAIIWSALPISEVRGGIPVAIAQGINPITAFFLCVIANCIAIPITFLFLDYLHKFLINIELYRIFFERHLEKARKKLEKSIGANGEFIALVLFVGIPLPMTGAYTGTLLAWFLNMDRKKAYLSITLGVFISAAIVTTIVLGGIKILDFLV